MQTDITFSVKSLQNINKTSIYNYDETSFQLAEAYDTRTIYVGHQHLTLEADTSSATVIGLSGYFNLSQCDSFEFDADKLIVNNNSVSVLFKETPEPGVGYPYTIAGISEYDANQKVLKIGSLQDTYEFIQISDNTILGLEANRLKCIFITSI